MNNIVFHPAMPSVSRLAASLLWLLLPALAHAQLNDTGQTACTDSAGTAIACNAVSDHPGQDGRFGRDAQAGAPAFRLTADSGCVQDNITGLTWADETLAPAPWASFNGMAYSRCGIASGWRLPTRRELLSIVHHGAYSPAIDGAYFPATVSGWYWTNDSYAPDPASAWSVDFNDGYTNADYKTFTLHVRLVRSGQ